MGIPENPQAKCIMGTCRKPNSLVSPLECLGLRNEPACYASIVKQKLLSSEILVNKMYTSSFLFCQNIMFCSVIGDVSRSHNTIIPA